MTIDERSERIRQTLKAANEMLDERRDFAAEVLIDRARGEFALMLEQMQGPTCSICRARHPMDDRHPCE